MFQFSIRLVRTKTVAKGRFSHFFLPCFNVVSGSLRMWVLALSAAMLALVATGAANQGGMLKVKLQALAFLSSSSSES
jgi:hypothetical protein